MSQFNPNLVGNPSITTETQVGPNTPVAQIEPIITSRSAEVYDADSLAKIIEYPLRKPCVELWNKGIRTISSSANKKDLQRGYSYLTLDWSTLSDENKQIALANATRVISSKDDSEKVSFEQENMHMQNRVVWVNPYPTSDNDGKGEVVIAIPLQATTKAEIIEKETEEITNKFKKQPAVWVREYTLDDIKTLYGMGTEDDATPEDFSDTGFYYDASKGKFFHSKDEFKLKYGE